jgi:hypothetical protein
LFVGSWGSSVFYSLFTGLLLGFGDDAGYTAWGFAPLVGPWVQSTQRDGILETLHRFNGGLQLAGLAAMVMGLTLEVPTAAADTKPPPQAKAWTVRTTAWARVDGGGLGLAVRF